MDNFLIELQAGLDEAASKGKIDEDIKNKLQGKVNDLKIQATLDPKAAQNLADEIGKLVNKKITISNIDIDASSAVKNAQKTSEQIGDTISKNLNSSLNSIRKNINDTIKGINDKKLNSYDLTKMFNIDPKKVDSSTIQQVRNLTNELNSLAKEALKTNSDDSWDGIFNKIKTLSNILSKFGSGRDTAPFKESLDVLDYFSGKKIFIDNKSEVLANTGLSIRELNNQFRNLGVTFTTVSEGSTKLDTIWSELFNISPNLQNFSTFGDQLNAIVEHFKIAKEAMYGDKNLYPIDTSETCKPLLEWLDTVQEASKKLKVFRDEETELEKRITQSSTASANTIVQNEEKKQRAYKETGQIQTQLSKSESLIESGAGDSAIHSIQNISTAVDDVRNHFRELLGDEKTVITSLKSFNGNELDAFTVNVKRASGEVESLRYKIEDSTILFDGGKINDVTVVKQINQIERKYTEFYNKLNNLKSSYSETSFDASEFEELLNNFRNGEISANKLSVAFNELKNTAQTQKKMLNSQDSSFDPIQQTLNNMRDLPNLIKNVETGMGNLKDKTSLADVSVKDLFSTYDSLKSEMDSTGGKVPLTDEWITKYRELMSTVSSVQTQIETLKKAEASDNSQATKQANYYSSILASYRQMYDIKKKLLTAGEEEAKVLEQQRKSISSSIAANYKQLGEQGLKDGDWQSQVDALKKQQEYQLNLTQARIRDKENLQEQIQVEKELERLRKQEAEYQQKRSQSLAEGEKQTQEEEILRQSIEYYEQEKYYQEQRAKSLAEGKAQQEAYNEEVKETVEYYRQFAIEADKAYNAQQKTNEKDAKRVNEIQLSMDNGNGASEYQNRINSIIASLQRYGIEAEEAKTITVTLQSTFDKMKEMSGQELINQADKLEEEFKKVKISVDQAKLSYDKLMQPASKEKIASTLIKIQKLLNNNTRVTEQVQKEWQNYVNRLSTGSNIAEKEIRDINLRLKETESEMRSMGRMGLSWPDKIKQAWEKFGGWGFATGSMMTFVDHLIQIPQEVIKVNSAMVELHKVSDASASDIEKYFDEAANSAKKYGSAVSDMINATADWSRLGYSLPDSKELAEVATLYKNVGDGIDIDTANESLVSTLQGFKLNADDAMHIIDSFNEVGNNFAIGSDGIGEALKRSASSMYAAGNTLEETIGLVTAANDVVQDPDSIGTAYKTISMRIRAAKTEMEELGLDTECMAESTATLQKEIMALSGVDIMKDKDTFKSTYQILDELATKWQDLTDIQQASITELIAGKRQGNIVSALMSNFETARQANETAVNSTGSALREQNEYEKGIEYSLDRLEASFQTFANHILKSKFLKGIIDFGDSAVNVIDNVTSKLDSLGTIGLGAGLVAGVKNVGMA